MSVEYGPAGSNPHRRILASAGSGKTFELTNRYLALVQAGAPPSSVLASTFSRAAAAEIRDRVLRRAAAAVLEPARRTELASGMGVPGFDVDAARGLLETLVAALPRLQIRTIDSVFAGVTIAFAAELGLPADPRVLDDGEERDVTRAAIGRALAVRSAEQILATLLSLARGERKSSVVPAIERAIDGLLPLRADSAVDAWDWDEPPRSSDDDWDRIDAELEGLAAGVEKKSIQRGVREDRARLLEARSGDAARAESWIQLASKGIVAKVAAGEPKYGGTPIPDDVLAAYRPLCDAVRAEIRRGYARMTRATAELLDVVGASLRAERLQRGVVSFEDLTRALDPSAQSLPALDEIWFRLDARIQHMLLDEFQDTNAAQWRALRPIAGEIAAHGDGGSSLFVVGDLKQSIYGWRGGEPGILDRLGEVTIDGGRVEFREKRLAKSFRSSPQVIEAVNLVFRGIAGNQSVADQSATAASAWQEWWEPHTTHLTDLDGFARFVELPTEDGDTDELLDDVRVRLAADAAQRHWSRCAAGGLDVGVLVRRNAMVGRIVAELQRRGVPAQGRGGGSLHDAEAVLATVQALRLAEWPDDSIAAYDLAHSPLRGLVGLDGGTPVKSRRRAVSAELRARFVRHGAAAVVDRWRRRLRDLLDTREGERMRQLVEVLEQLEVRADRSPGELARLVAAARVDAPGGGGVTVMNVHQSKGLEFGVVIVTDLGAQLGVDGSRQKIAWSSPPRPAEPIPSVTRWVKDEVRWPEVRPPHEATQERAVLESLCVLYVALTRARAGLEVHVDPVRINKDGGLAARYARSLSAVVRTGLPVAACSDAESELTVLWETGTVATAHAPVAWASAPVDGSLPALRVTGSRRRARGRRADAASRHASERRFLFELADAEASDRGRAIHACFESVEWLDDGGPGDADLLEAIAAAAPARDRGWGLARLGEFRDAIGRPAVRALLTRAAGGTVRVRREHRYVRVTGAGLQEGAIDRLVLHTDASGRVVAADVIDFKTGSTGGRSELLDRHAAQLRTYRDVVVEQFCLAADAVRMQIVATASGVVALVPASDDSEIG